jgi:outer membrane murein-binding lipoprotein Lpp
MQIDEFDLENALVKDMDSDLIARRETNFVKFVDGTEIDLRYDGHGDPYKKYEIDFYQLQALINYNQDIDLSATVDNLNDKIDDLLDDEKSDWEMEKEEEIQNIKEEYEIKIDSLEETIQSLNDEIDQLNEDYEERIQTL